MSFLGKFFGEAGGTALSEAAEGVGNAAIKLRTAFTGDLPPEAQQAMKEFDYELEKLGTSLAQAVNETMRAESKSGHWMQWSWRPTVGFTFAGMIINNYILLPYFASYGLQSIDIPGHVWNALLVVLGAAAATRGLEKWQRVKGK